MAKYDYNIIVIGAGSGGLVTAYIAAALKAKVALIEKHKMGGDCLNTGCVPSKALIRTSKMLNYIKRHKEFGIKTASANIDFKDVMSRVKSIVKEIEPHDSVERYTGLGVECFTGDAKIKSANEVVINKKTITARNIVIASGARPFVPPIKGLDKIKYLTSDNLWDLKTQPKKLVVLGGGPIGCEMAQSFARLGTKVTQIEMLDRIMVREDEDAAKIVADSFKKDGVEVLTKHKAKEFVVKNGKKYIIAEHKGKDVKIEFDQVLVAIGRKARVEGFGLEDLKIELNQNGTIKTDAYLRTNYKNVYAVGDVAGPFQFTHAAAHQAWYAAVNSLLVPFFKADYSHLPWCTFTDPEVARIGLNEQEAKQQGIKVEVTKYGIDDLDRAIADSEAKGFVKVLTKPDSDKILGVTIVGSHAGDLLAEFVLAMKNKIGLNKILGTIHSYPTLAEANKYAAGVWKRNNKPEWALNLVEKFHKWRRG